MTLPLRAVVRTLFSFQGRVSSAAYSLMIVVMNLVGHGVAFSVNGWNADLFGTNQARILANLILIWPRAAVTVKRGHDRGRSIGYSLAFLLTSFAGLVLTAIGRGRQDFDLVLLGAAVWVAAGFYQFVEYALLAGDPGANRYGSPPRDFYAAKPASSPRDDALPDKGASA